MGLRRFEGKVALVTGAALGMGRATARRFAQEGAKVCVVDIMKDGVEETAAMIRAEGGEAFACVADISQEADNERMADETIARYGRLDAVDLNAAVLGQHSSIAPSPITIRSSPSINAARSWACGPSAG
jgi:NAD(P)-dependent dehydrogenase (short-subunit alcohol dehydrogenase family)